MSSTNLHPSGDESSPIADKANQSDRNSALDFVAPAAAVAILVLFAYVLVRLLQSTSLPPQEWDRALHLLNGVEAVAFAAAGYLFGKEVHRREAKRADERAQEAQGRAEKSGLDAANGRRLARKIKDASRHGLRPVDPDSDALQHFSSNQPPPVDPVLADLARSADDLFPDV